MKHTRRSFLKFSAGSIPALLTLNSTQACKRSEHSAPVPGKKIGDHDVVVAGGGIAGTMAAIAAAREGAKTILIERYSALGGMSTMGMVQPMSVWGLGTSEIVGGSGRLMLEKWMEESPDSIKKKEYYGYTCDTEFLKYMLELEALKHGVTILYHTWLNGLAKLESQIISLEGVAKGGPVEITGKIFIDATGDADVAAFSGVPFETDNQGMTLMMQISGIDFDRVPEGSEINNLYRPHPDSYRSGLLNFPHPKSGIAYFNSTGVTGHSGLDPEDLTDATISCREQAWYQFRFLKENIPGFENSYISQTAPALGVRETRRIKGIYQLTIDDADTARPFEDVIARCSNPVDVHGFQGQDKIYRWFKKSYEIPYRALVTGEISNLIVTGRPISADHMVHSSIRRQATGFALGEVAGIAAFLALKNKNDTRSIPVNKLQDTLRKYKAILDPEITPE